MRRFLVLFRDVEKEQSHYSEGLVHYDGSVYLRWFYEREQKLFTGLYEMRCFLQNCEELRGFDVLMLDPEEKKG